MTDVHVGDVFLCASRLGWPSALATVGKVDRGAEMGLAGELADALFVHVRIGPAKETRRARMHIEHECYPLDAFLACCPQKVGQGEPPGDAFWHRYRIFLDELAEGTTVMHAVRPDRSGSPADIYWELWARQPRPGED